MLRLKRISAVIILVLAVLIIISNNMLGKPPILKPVISVSGKVLYKANSSPFGTKIFIFNEFQEKIGVCKSNSLDGSYFLTGLKPDAVYYLSIESSKRSIKKIKLLTPKAEEYAEITRDIIIDNEKNNIELFSKK